MISSAVKRDAFETEYQQHAWIDDGHNVGFDGYPMNRLHVIGDRIVLDAGIVVEVVETFDGFDFHTNEPVHCYKTKNVCRHCSQVIDGDGWKHYRGLFDSSCVNGPALEDQQPR